MTYTTRPARTSDSPSRPGDPLPPGTPERAPDGALRMAPSGVPDGPPVAPPDAAELDLYTHVGGSEGAQAIAEELRRRVKDDPELGRLAAISDDAVVADLEAKLVTLVLGGPVLTDTTTLFDPLRDTGASIDEFRQFSRHLLDALLAGGMPAEGVDEVVGRLTVVVHEALAIPSESS
jgi:hypothetical protein